MPECAVSPEQVELVQYTPEVTVHGEAEDSKPPLVTTLVVPPPPELLALDDVASLHLDVAAIERGYHRPVGSGFRIELAVPEQAWVEELDEV